MTGLDLFLDGVLAGRVEQATGGALSFTYDVGYTSGRSPTPLSLSMPLSGQRHGNRVVSAWLDGLLPDNAAVREEWGRRFQVSARNPFALLRHVGRDAAGAVQVLPVDVDPSDAAQRTGGVRRLSEAKVWDLLRELTVRDAGRKVGAGSGRWSLAGAQDKDNQTSWSRFNRRNLISFQPALTPPSSNARSSPSGEARDGTLALRALTPCLQNPRMASARG